MLERPADLSGDELRQIILSPHYLREERLDAARELQQRINTLVLAYSAREIETSI
jgi:hypothetical protein